MWPPASARPTIRPEARPQPPPEFEANGSRYRRSSRLYGRLVVSDHTPPATGSPLSEANAAVYAPGRTTPGAVRAWANCSNLVFASADSSPASPTFERRRSRHSRRASPGLRVPYALVDQGCGDGGEHSEHDEFFHNLLLNIRVAALHRLGDCRMLDRTALPCKLTPKPKLVARSMDRWAEEPSFGPGLAAPIRARIRPDCHV